MPERDLKANYSAGPYLLYVKFIVCGMYVMHACVWLCVCVALCGSNHRGLCYLTKQKILCHRNGALARYCHKWLIVQLCKHYKYPQVINSWQIFVSIAPFWSVSLTTRVYRNAALQFLSRKWKICRICFLSFYWLETGGQMLEVDWRSYISIVLPA